MTDLKVLEELGMALDPSAPPPDRLRRRVLTEATHPSRRWSRWFVAPAGNLRVPAVIGGLAALVTAGILAVQVVPFGDDGPASQARAAQVLQGAAAQALRQPTVTPNGKQFIFVESITNALGRNEATKADAQEIQLERRVWLSVDGTKDGLIQQRPRSGAGAWQEIPLPGCHDGVSTHTKYGKTASVPCQPTPAYASGLPIEADGMLSYLHKKGGGTKNPPDQEAFEAAGELIREAYLSPASLAAVFEALAKIPGVAVVTDVTDEAGRGGVAVALTEVQGMQTELIFDRNSYTFLGERSVLIHDQDGLKAGQVLNSTAVLTVAVVDRVSQIS